MLQDAEIDGAERVVIGPVYPLVITRNAGGKRLRTKRPDVGNVEIARRKNRVGLAAVPAEKKEKKKQVFQIIKFPSSLGSGFAWTVLLPLLLAACRNGKERSAESSVPAGGEIK